MSTTSRTTWRTITEGNKSSGVPDAAAPIREKTFVRADGSRVYARMLGARSRVAGAEDKLPLLILDGIGCAGWAFRRLGPTLGRQRQVVLMHYRGHGKSPLPARPWRLGIHTFADDAEAVCAEMGLDRVIVMGFSMGFQVALELYRRHRHRVAALVSLAGPSGRVLDNFQGTDAFGRGLPILAASTRIARRAAKRGIWERLLPSALPLQLGMRSGQVNTERLDPKDLEVYLTQLATMPPDLFLSLLEQAHRHSAADVLPSIRVPTLVIAGARDGFVPVDVLRRMAFAIPGAQWELISDASHALPAEYPDELARRVTEFIAGFESDEPGPRGPPGKSQR